MMIFGIGKLQEIHAAALRTQEQTQRTLKLITDRQARYPSPRQAETESADRLLIAENVIAEMRAFIREIEWSGVRRVKGVDRAYCPVCRNDKTKGHAPGCRIMLTLGPRRLSDN